MVEPPCATFSADAYPALRSYTEPRGHNPRDPKTVAGTTLALRSLSLMVLASETGVAALLEQPLSSKMACLSERRFLLDSGKARPSATYCDGLAEAFARGFHEAVHLRLRRKLDMDIKVTGLESVAFNDLLVSRRWRVEKSWRWRSRSHINILEASAVGRLICRLAVDSPSCRVSVGIDSHVALSAIAKGRTPSYGLRPAIRRLAALQVAGDLYLACHFAPTRLNPANHPTRDHPMPERQRSCLAEDRSFQERLEVLRLSGLSKRCSSWVRLVVFLLGGRLPWWTGPESWRYRHRALWGVPGTLREGRVGSKSGSSAARQVKDFDSTLGFPGEGPSIYPTAFSWTSRLSSCGTFAQTFCSLFLLLHLLPLLLTALPMSVLLSFAGAGRRHPSFVLCVGIGSAPGVLAVESHGMSCAPRDVRDRARALSREGLFLHDGRPVTGKTQAGRDRLLLQFGCWLESRGLSLTDIVSAGGLDVESINILLTQYGCGLFHGGRPYNQYSETINAVAGRRPRLRRSLQGAWDLAYAWLREEPPTHHLAMPWQVLCAAVVVAVAWGWVCEAVFLALTFGAIARIGEVLQAKRQDLLLPCDFGDTLDHILLTVKEPKTRFRGARHQVARLDQPQLVQVVTAAFRGLGPADRLWPYSPQTLRSRFKKIMQELGLDGLGSILPRGLDLGSLRAGGATWLLAVSENSELVRRRGRWVNSKVMEIDIQEAASVQFLHRLPDWCRAKILECVAVFPWIIAWADSWSQVGVPFRAWRPLLGALATQKGLGEGNDGWRRDTGNRRVHRADMGSV